MDERMIIWVTVDDKYITELPIIREKIAKAFNDEYGVVASPKAITPINRAELILLLEETVSSLKK